MKLKDFVPTEFSLSLLKTLEAGGVGAPVLFGGAIRDQFLGIPDKIKDYDVWADFGTCCDVSELQMDDIPEIIKTKILDILPGATHKKTEGFDRSEQTGFTAIKLILDYEGQEVSLFLNNLPQSAENKIQGDAPINAVVMDSDGRIFAHPLFEEHVNSKVYQAFPFVPEDVAQSRFDHLSKKIDGLQMTTNSGNSAVLSELAFK